MTSREDTPQRLASGLGAVRHAQSMTAASHYRSRRRSAAVTFRMTPQEYERMRERAQQDGVTMQTLLERLVFNRPDAADLRPGPQRRDAGEQTEMPIPAA